MKFLTGFSLAIGLSWGLLRYGATESHTYYRLFLLMLGTVLVLAWSIPAANLRKKSTVLAAFAGLALLAPVFLLTTFRAEGFIILSLGWSAFFVTLILSHGNRRGRDTLVFLLIVLGALEAVYGLAQAFGGFDYIGEYSRGLGRMATGTFINHNHYVGFLNMVLPFAAGAIFSSLAVGSLRTKRSEHYSRAWLMSLGCSLMGLAIFLSLSRTGVLILSVNLAFVAFLLAWTKLGQTSKTAAKGLGFLLLFLTVVLSGWVGWESLAGRFLQLDKNWDWRLVLYSDSLKLLHENPWYGIGPGMYLWHFRPYQTHSGELIIEHAHNDYLQTTIEWGIPLAVLFWGLVLWRFCRGLRLFRHHPDPWVKGLSLGCAAAILSVLLHSFFDFNLQIPLNLMVFCMILAISCSLESSPDSPP